MSPEDMLIELRNWSRGKGECHPNIRGVFEQFDASCKIGILPMDYIDGLIESGAVGNKTKRMQDAIKREIDDAEHGYPFKVRRLRAALRDT